MSSLAPFSVLAIPARGLLLLVALTVACATGPAPGETCGNGALDEGEDCDPAIEAGRSGACPADCADANPCTTERLAGSAAKCSARCEVTLTTACGTGDGCCPAGCTEDADAECAPRCGNGHRDPGELCDGDCPLSCSALDACHPGVVVGSAAHCDAGCGVSEISACVSGDGCCPPACSRANDGDCTNGVATCGNGVVDGGETCDKAIASGLGSCPTSCPPAAACFVAGVVGSAAGCSASCQTAAVTACTGGDGCCPSGCTASTDTDCRPATRVGLACSSNADCGGLFCDSQNFDLGYCSRTCSTDADCGAGAHCSRSGATDPGFCYRDCTERADCGRGADIDCFDADDDGRLDCEEIAHGTGAVGAPCTDYGDCAGGRAGHCLGDLPGGYCTIECATTSECPAGSHCSGGGCFANCSTDVDCTRREYVCADVVLGGSADGVKECVPGADGPGAVGAACTSDYDCGGGRNGGCLTESGADMPGGYCSVSCTRNADCPAGSHCSTGLCLQDCTTDAQCPRAGYVCYDLVPNDAATGDGRKECFLGGDGPGAVGSVCGDVSACAGGAFAECLVGACARTCGGGEGPCPAGSSCEDVGRPEQYCVKHCASDADCPGGECWASNGVSFCAGP